MHLKIVEFCGWAGGASSLVPQVMRIIRACARKFSFSNSLPGVLNTPLCCGQSGTPGQIEIKPFLFCTREGARDKSPGKEKKASEMQVGEERAELLSPCLPPGPMPPRSLFVSSPSLLLAVGQKALNLTDVHKASCSFNLHI